MRTKEEILASIFRPKTSRELEFTAWLFSKTGIYRAVMGRGDCLEPSLGSGIYKDSGGYNQIWLEGRSQSFHRLIFFLSNPDTTESMLVLHSCDNPACCRLDHLFAGTHSDNTQDMLSKDRGNFRYGINNHNTKLTQDDVSYIRSVSRRRKSNTQLALELGVSQRCISAVRLNQTHKG